jgi:hypothetical protein
MAITYKSQGAGVSTETSGAALSPLCPATVDAGDILIAHVFWEGTATAPSTPSGWEPLSGPHLIETTIARHWVFGKIAAGTEDGAAVAFGSPAVTTQRAARIYSFAGRVGGTITELVTGFVHQSNANDPTFPSVTTTLAGALAVALVAQNDNNTLASATGESGGNWTEATAEYTVALNPGFSLGIQTATPTGDPGTISGGTDNTTNDPVGVIGFQIKQSNNQNVDAGVGAATFTGFAPTVTTTANQNILPGVGALSATGFAPTVFTSENQSALPGAGAVAFTGFEPTVQIGVNTNAETGALSLSGFEPTVITSDHQNTEPGTGVATLVGFEPTVTVSDNQNVSPGSGQIIFEGFAPTVGSDAISSPAVGQITFTGFAPTVETSEGVEIEPGAGAITLSGFSPTVSISDNTNIEAGKGEIIFEGFAPSVQVPMNIVTQKGGIIFIGYEPVVTISDNTVINPSTGELLFQGFEPTVSTSGGEATTEPETGLLIFEGFAPTVQVAELVELELESDIQTSIALKSIIQTAIDIDSNIRTQLSLKSSIHGLVLELDSEIITELNFESHVSF